MEIIQSYNHFMPQSIIKNGWGFKCGKKTSVNILDYSRLKDFIFFNPNFNKGDLLIALKQNFGETEDKNNNLVIRRNPDSIMGNKLIFNLTEQKLGNLQFHVEKDIEYIISESLKHNKVEENNISQLYKWFALQKARSMAELMNTYSHFLNKGKLVKINSEEQYYLFKKIYNKRVHDYFNYYIKQYNNEKYIAFIPQFIYNEKEIFLFLGELNTLHGENFSNVLFENKNHLTKYGCILEPMHYCLLNKLDISVISKNKFMMLLHPKITLQEGTLLAEAISTCWNAYQVAQETQNLVVSETFDETTELIADIIMYQKKNGTLEKNVNFQYEYLELVESSKKYEKQINFYP